MAKKMDYSDIATVIDNFTKASRAKYDTTAFSAGYLGSLLAGIMADMPLAKQCDIVNMLNKSSVYTKDTV